MQTTGGLRARLWGLVFLTVLGGTVTLLIAGYGVAVGLGALGGLILGSVAAALGVMWLLRGSGRSVTFGSMEWSSDRALSSEGPSPELMAELRELSEISSIDLGAIQAVRPVLLTAEAGGLSVQLVTIEQHEAGLAMTVEIRTGVGAASPASMARVSVADDVGTVDKASAQGQGSSPGAMRYVVSVIPAFPRSATQLDVRIDSFLDPFPGGGRASVGPWAFSVALDPAHPPTGS